MEWVFKGMLGNALFCTFLIALCSAKRDGKKHLITPIQSKKLYPPSITAVLFSCNPSDSDGSSVWDLDRRMRQEDGGCTFS